MKIKLHLTSAFNSILSGIKLIHNITPVASWVGMLVLGILAGMFFGRAGSQRKIRNLELLVDACESIPAQEYQPSKRLIFRAFENEFAQWKLKKARQTDSCLKAEGVFYAIESPRVNKKIFSAQRVKRNEKMNSRYANGRQK